MSAPSITLINASNEVTTKRNRKRRPDSELFVKRRITKEQKRRDSKKVLNRTNWALVDEVEYEIEKIVTAEMITSSRRLKYWIKWKGYPSSENSKEDEWRLQSGETLVDYAARKCRQKMMTRIGIAVKAEPGVWKTSAKKSTSTEFCRDQLPVSILVQHFFEGPYTRFMFNDAVSIKQLLFEQLVDKYDLFWTVASLSHLDEIRIDEFMEKWGTQLNSLLVQHDYAAIEPIAFGSNRHGSAFLPCPPLLSRIIMQCIDGRETNNNLSNVVRKRSELLPPDNLQNVHSYPLVQPFLNQKELDEYADVMLLENLKKPKFAYDAATNGCERLHFGTLLFARDIDDSFWHVCSSCPVEAGEALMPICGVVRDVSVAAKCMREESELIAFSSFVHIPGTDLCIDQRELFDLSRFVHHSCSPNCGIRVVHGADSGVEGVPMLQIYAKRKIAAEELLTVDWYSQFTKAVKKFFDYNRDEVEQIGKKTIYLLEKNIDHVSCSCYSRNCRKILFVDPSASQAASKFDRLEEMSEKLNYRGLEVADKQEKTFCFERTLDDTNYPTYELVYKDV